MAEADPDVGAFGYMINCGPPSVASKILAEMASVTTKPLGVYPNKLYTKDFTVTKSNSSCPEIECSLSDFEAFVREYM